MKKKIIYGLLFAVAMVTASSSFVSCKDYEGDDYALLKEKNAALEEYLNAQIAAIQKCNCDLSKYALITQLPDMSQYALLSQLPDLSGYAKLSDIPSLPDLSGYAKLTDIPNMPDLSGYAKLADIPSLDGYAKVSDIPDLGGYVKTADLVTAIGSNSEAIVTLLIDQIASQGGFLQTDLSNYLTKSQVMDSIQKYITGNPEIDLSAYATKEELKNYTTLAQYIQLGDSVKNLYAWATYMKTRTQNISDSLKIAYDQAQTNKDSIKILADSIDRVAAIAEENFKQAKELADSAITLAWYAIDSIGKLDARISDVEEAYKLADEKLQEQIDALTERVDSVEKAIENIFGALKKQITSIEIQGTYNPVFGTFGIPVGIQNNVLAAFYGTAENEVKFPAYQKKYYVNGDAWISKAEWDAIGLDNVFEASQGESLIADEGNAGTLYVTVNPSNVDFEGTDFSMRTSDNQKSKMQLSPLEPSTKRLTFGYTRGNNSPNGFYEMKATVDINDAAALAPNFDIKSVGSSVIQVMKDVKNTATTAKNTHEITGARQIVKDLAKVVAELYANSSDILPRLGIQANWIDPVTGPKCVTSKYEIAATAIKPLGFGTLGKVWSLHDISFTPNHTFIQYIDGKAIDKEIYDLVMENLKLEMNLNLGLDINFEELKVAITPQNNVIFTIPVMGYDLKPDALWAYNKNLMRMELLVSDPTQPDGIARDPNGNIRTAGVYYALGTLGEVQEGEGDWRYLFNTSKEGWGIFSVDENNIKKQKLVLDMTDLANVLLYGEPDKDADGNYVRGADGYYSYADRIANGYADDENSGIFGTLNEQLDKFNNHIGDINGMEDKIEDAVNAAVEEAMTQMGTNIYQSLSDFVLGYVNKANKWIARLNRYGNKALDYLINDPDRYVQPMLFSYNSNHKLTVVGRSRLNPSVANAGNVVALYPSTMTLETVAPAFKKHLAISNVYNNKTGKNAVYDKDAAAQAVMAAANKTIGATEVIDGGTQESIQKVKALVIPANASGMTLEIVYTALGYDGKIAGKKFYIRVK